MDIANIPQFVFFQIKKTMVTTEDGTQRFSIQFIDMSSRIFYNELKAEEDFAELYTSSISHEMRNPLNSIKS